MPMIVANATAAGQAQIRDVMADWVTAACAKDVDRLMSHHAPDVLLFDVVNPLRYAGVDAARTRMEDWFSSFQGPINYEMRDMTIAADEDVAFCHSLQHVNGTRIDGTTLDVWWRATVCFRKLDSRWLVTHAHSSVPFDGETGRASLDLKP
jgi:uncharacterized protein (TIGR02246 family)